MFFGDAADQAFKELCNADGGKHKKGEKGKHAGRQQGADGLADSAGGGDKKRRDTCQYEKGEGFDVHPAGAIGESGSQGIQRHGNQKEQQGGNRKGHGSHLITSLLYCMGAESDVEGKYLVTVQSRTLLLLQRQ